jgi:hypothetical protein
MIVGSPHGVRGHASPTLVRDTSWLLMALANRVTADWTGVMARRIPGQFLAATGFAVTAR